MAQWVDIKPQLYTLEPGTASTTAPQDTLGTERKQIDLSSGDVRTLKLLLVAGTSASFADKDVGYFTNTKHTGISTKVSEAVASSGINSFAGVAIGTVALASYAWFLVEGLYTLNLEAAQTAAAGDVIIGSSTDVKVNKVAADTAPTNTVVGVAVAAGSGAGGTVATYVRRGF